MPSPSRLAADDKARYTDAFDREVCRIISGTVFPAFRNLLTFLMIRHEKRLAPEPHAPILRLSDSVHLPFSADVVLELGDERIDPSTKVSEARSTESNSHAVATIAKMPC
jgi:hypothetical protein